MTREDQMPHHIDVVQCYVYGNPNVGGVRGIAVNGRYVTIRDSYVPGWWSYDYDSQAILGTSCQFVHIANNYLEATGENVFFNEASNIPNFWPSDITITRNHLNKPVAWRDMRQAVTGKVLAVKNVFELKSGRRVHVHGNVLQHCWKAAQTGNVISLKPGQAPGANPSLTEDVLIERNLIIGGTICAAVTGQAMTSKGMGICRRATIRQNAFVGVGADWGAAGRLFVFAGPPCDSMIIEDNTVTAGGSVSHAIAGSGDVPAGGFVFSRNLMPLGAYGVKLDGAASGIP